MRTARTLLDQLCKRHIVRARNVVPIRIELRNLLTKVCRCQFVDCSKRCIPCEILEQPEYRLALPLRMADHLACFELRLDVAHCGFREAHPPAIAKPYLWAL